MPRIFRSMTVLAAFALVFITSRPIPVSADTSFREYEYLVAVDFLCDLDATQCPAVSMAANGDIVEIAGQGTLTIHPKSVTGEGSFTHIDSDGNILAEGTWTVTELVAFHSYGSASAQGLSEDWEGGLALIRVQLSVGGAPVADGVLRVTCALGDKIPASSIDGARLAVQDGTNFNEEVSGFTLFIRVE